MNWYCFKFLLTWRFLTALLSHFNWLTAIYMKCVYFTIWKSFDILWFWMHIILCVCFKQLRSENFLLIFFNLILKKHNQYSNKTYKEIYKLLYCQRYTKSEKALKHYDLRQSGNSENEQSCINNLSSDENTDEEIKSIKIKKTNLSNNDKNKLKLYPSLLQENCEQEMPNIILNRNTNKFNYNKKTNLLLDDNVQNNNDLTNKKLTEHLKTKISKIIPKSVANKLIKNSTINSVESNKSDLSKEEKILQKAKEKELIINRKKELKIQAKKERRAKNLAVAIDLLLTKLRLMTTFANLVGNIHKNFLPRYIKAPDENFFDNPDLLMIFTITMSLDIVLFWVLMFLTYFRQFRLCCQLGLLRFMFWLIIFGLLTFSMYYPMHYINEQLDLTWCTFEPGTPLSEYFDNN